MTKPARKPLRRTAWSMLLGGLAVAALMFGVGAYLVSNGEPAGPGHSATWPAATELSVNRPLGPQQDGGGTHSVVCTLSPEAGEPTQTRLTWGDRNQPNFAGSATITCEHPARILTDPQLTIATITRGPLIMLPLFTTLLGALFFFPRFTRLWAALSNNPSKTITTHLTNRTDKFL